MKYLHFASKTLHLLIAVHRESQLEMQPILSFYEKSSIWPHPNELLPLPSPCIKLLWKLMKLFQWNSFRDDRIFFYPKTLLQTPVQSGWGSSGSISSPPRVCDSKVLFILTKPGPCFRFLVATRLVERRTASTLCRSDAKARRKSFITSYTNQEPENEREAQIRNL